MNPLLLLMLAQPVEGIEFTQKLGAQVPLDAKLADEQGEEVFLGSLIGGRPTVFALVYYECPMLCTLVTNGIIGALRAISLTPGEDFEVVLVSIDPKEGPELARKKKTSVLNRYARPETAPGWHLTTTTQPEIDRLADAIGFSYVWDAKTQQYAHAAGFVVLTPEGKVARYFYGVEYAPRDVRLALVESASERIGNFVDAVLLYCYHYDPETGKYGVTIMRIIRIAALFTIFALGFAILRALRAEKRRAA